MTYRLRHLSRYDYSQPVTLSHHAAHLRPRTLAGRQVCLVCHLSASPTATVLSERLDTFGNALSLLTIESPHTTLDIRCESRVRVTPWLLPVAEQTPPWEQVATHLRAVNNGTAADPTELEALPFLPASRHAPLVEALDTLTAPCFPPGRPVLQGALALTELLYQTFTYDPTATDIATPIAAVLAGRRGVCQDFAHVQIAALRRLGLAARYVSGYIHTGSGLAGVDASHAWVSLWVPGLGWVDLDPTNNKFALEEHIVVAWGRDFEDVSPLKGVMIGGGSHDVSVSVEMIPEFSPSP